MVNESEKILSAFSQIYFYKELVHDLFMDYRYFFEHESVGYSNFFTDLVHIVCDYALSMKEDLSNRIDEMD